MTTTSDSAATSGVTQEQPAPESVEELAKRLIRERVEPIAVVGLGLRFPGDNQTRQEFTEFLRQGGCGTTSIPGSRWDTAAYDSEGRTEPGKVRTSGGGFLGDLTQFDPRFFNISPKEAQYIDPQQRLALETAWEALEDAGIDPTQVQHQDGGVYVGVSCVDFTIEVDDLALDQLDPHVGTGTAHSAVPGRVSYFLGWRGPSIAVDTACSSSLTALHLAVAALRGGECSIALCGGVNAIHHPRNHIVFSQANMLAPDGRCKTFDESADGYSRSEGAGMIVLRRLSDARRDGNRILGLVRGTAIRQDGESGGLTVPNGAAQQNVMRAALSAGGLRPEQIGGVEAHGTGTSLGDPIEMAAISAVFAESHSPEDPLVVSSLKTNVGHMEAAAGIGGLAKALVQLREGMVVPHLNLERPSSHIDWDSIPVVVPQKLEDWGDRPPRILVNSFGFAGSIASAVLERAPESVQPTAAPSSEDEPSVLTLSARTGGSLSLLAERYAEVAETAPTGQVADLAYTSNVARTHFPYRAAARVRTPEDVRALAARVAAKAPTPLERKTAFLFSGQGSQYLGMGAPLYRRFGVFRETVDACDQAFGDRLGSAVPAVRDVITGELADPAELSQTRLTQPALFTLELALARCWQDLGIAPDLVLGHSIGEIVAATVSGLFELDDAVRLTAERARLMQSVSTPGGMCAVLAEPDEIRAVLADSGRLDSDAADSGLGFAAFNAPGQCVLSGAVGPLEQAREALTAAGHRTIPLDVSHAFHSPLMHEVYDEFRQALSGLRFSPPTVPMMSNVTGALARFEDVADPEYWIRHIGSPVRFADSIAAVDQRGDHRFLEIGPGPTLIGLGRRTASRREHTWTSSLSPDDPDQIEVAAAALYESGADLDWPRLHSGRRVPVDAPLYAFDRKPFWLPAARRHSRLLDDPLHASGGPGTGHGSGMLGTAVSGTGPDTGVEGAGTEAATTGQEQVFRSRLNVDSVPWLRDHVVMGQVVFPGTGYVDLVLSLLEEVMGTPARTLADFVIHEPLLLQTDGPDHEVELITRCLGDAVTGFTVTVHSRPIEPGSDHQSDQSHERHHATLSVTSSAVDERRRPRLTEVAEELTSLLGTESQEGPGLDADDLYASFDELGLNYGPDFRRIRSLHVVDPATVAVDLRGRRADLVEFCPPDVLDGVIQSLGAVVPGDDETYLPVGARSIRFLSRPKSTRARAVARLRSLEPAADLHADLVLLDGDRPVLVVEGLTLRRAARGAARTSVHFTRDWVHRSLLRSGQDPAGDASARAPLTARVIGTGSQADQVAAELDARGHQVSRGGSASDHPAAQPGQPEQLIFVWSPEDSGEDLPGGSGELALDRIQQECSTNLAALLDLVRQAGAGRGPGDQSRLWLVTRHAQPAPDEPTGPAAQLLASTLWGFGLSLWTEYPELKAVLLDSDEDVAGIVDEIETAPAHEQQVRLRGGRRAVRRVRPAHSPADQAANLQLVPSADGNLDGLSVRVLDPETHDRAPGEHPDPTGEPVGDQLAIEVELSGLNFKDVLNALGMLATHAADQGVEYQPLPLGFEGAGRVVAAGPDATIPVGTEVLFSAMGSMRRRITVRGDCVVPRPAALSAAEAAGLPTAFITAHHALVTLAGLRADDTVLIHAAAGGVGQAAVQLARSVGATVIATASARKRDHLHSQGIEHVFDSRSLDFEQDVLRVTGGRGVDVVLNSLNNEFVDASMRCLRSGGRFVELGKLGVWTPERAAQERPDCAYHLFDLSEFPLEQLDAINRDGLHELVALVDRGAFTALPTTVYELDESAEAFGVLSRGSSIGKLVIRMQPRHRGPVVATGSASSAPAGVDPESLVVLTGGSGALAQASVVKLASLGARHFLLLSRSALTDEALDRLRSRVGGAVEISSVALDVSRPESVDALVELVRASGRRLGSVLHCAGVLVDKPIMDLTVEEVWTVLAPKVAGAWCLHEAAARLAQFPTVEPVDQFVLFSSVASVIGSAGQANYAAGNAYLDALAQWRGNAGLAGSSLNWGPWGELGMAAELSERHVAAIEAQGMQLLAPGTGLRALAASLDERPFGRIIGQFDWAAVADSRPQQTALYDDVATAREDQEDDPLNEVDWASLTPVERRELIRTRVRSDVARLLQFDSPDDVPPDESFHALGLDSLAGVELKNRLVKAFGCPLASSVALEYPSVSALGAHLESLLDPASGAEAAR